MNELGTVMTLEWFGWEKCGRIRHKNCHNNDHHKIGFRFEGILFLKMRKVTFHHVLNELNSSSWMTKNKWRNMPFGYCHVEVLYGLKSVILIRKKSLVQNNKNKLSSPNYYTIYHPLLYIYFFFPNLEVQPKVSMLENLSAFEANSPSGRGEVRSRGMQCDARAAFPEP